MAGVVRADRFYFGCGNLAAAIVCLPLCWGLPARDWVALKFGTAITGVALGVNAARLFSQYSEQAPIRAAWKESALMIDAAWIEQLAIANLPPVYQPAHLEPAGNYHLPAAPQWNFQSEQVQENEPIPERGDGRQLPNLSAYPSVLICGVPGSGKTTFAREEITRRLNLGHRVIVLDPHAAYGSWQGCEIVGGGMNYEAINKKLNWLFEEVKARYLKIQTEPNPKFQELSVVAEEFTKWSRKVKNSEELFWTALTDIRKVKICIVFVSHTRTLVAMGGAKGSADLRDEALLEVELQGEYNKQTGRATPKFQALVKMPGYPLSDRTLVRIERKSEPELPIPSATPGTPQNIPRDKPENPGTPDGIRAERFSELLAEILAETAPAVFSPEFPLEQEERVQLAKLVITQNLGVEKTILLLWGVRRGGRNHHLYVEAKAMLDRLTGEK